MPDTNYQSTRLALGMSGPLALLLLVAHGGALFCLMAIEGAWPIRLVIGAAILWSLFLTLCEHAFRCSRSAITTLSWTEEGVWKLWTRDGGTVALAAGRLSANQIFSMGDGGVRSYVRAFVVVLYFDTEKGFGRSVVLHPGMLDDEDAFRRLRVRLRFLSDHGQGGLWKRQ